MGVVDGVMAGTRDRFFVALPLPPEVRLAVDEWRTGLALPGRPVPLQKLHVTLRFVGPAERVGRERIVAALDAAALGGPFTFRIGGLGGFPRMRKASVAWAALEGDGERIARLAEVVDDAVSSAGFGYEERPFRAHLTLARIRPPRDIRRSVTGGPARISAPVTEVVFYRSRTEGSSIAYHRLECFPLRDS